jgi:hypothetical protein
MFRWIRQKLALRSYRGRLGKALVARYGREKRYTVNQVRATVEKLGLDADYICYAYAAYCERSDFDAHHAAIGESCDWAEMRDEMASSHGFSPSEHFAGGDHVYDHHHHHDVGDHHHGDWGGGHDGHSGGGHHH